MIRSQAAPVSGSERIVAVDVLRGFAIFGILLINIYGFSGLLLSPQSSTNGLDRIVMILMILLAQAKFYSLFSFLFGWGMSVQLQRTLRKGVSFVRLYLRRMFVLLLFGMLHGIFLWRGDILTSYAVLGMLLIFFRRTNPRRLLVWVILFLLLAIVTVVPGETMDSMRDLYAHITEFMRTGNMPSQSIFGYGSYWEITQRRAAEFFSSQSWFIYWLGNVFAMMLLGLLVGKRGILQDVEGHLPLIRNTLWIGLVIGLALNAIAVWVTADSSVVAPEHQRFVRVASRTIGAPALMLFYVSGLLLLMRKEVWRQRLAPLAPVGRMALSNYLFQSLSVSLLFYGYGLGLYGEITPTFALIIVVIVYLVQIRLSEWWMERYRFGPAEWLWRTLTYGRLQPLRREQPDFIAHKPRRLSRLVRSLAQLNSKNLLIVVWVILIVWAAALYAWNGRLNQQLGRSSLTLFSQEETTASAAEILATATPIRPLTIEQAIEPIVTPVVRAVDYRPSAVARSGDVQAMTDAIDVNQALKHIDTLAGSDYAGRLSGSTGGRAAGNYIADTFAEYGLQPAALDGTFFQPFPITYTMLTGIPKIEVAVSGDVPADDYTLYEDFSPIVIGYAGDGEGSGPVHWVNRCRPADFADLSLLGKIVFCQPEPGNDALIASTRLAKEYGAAGLLLLADEERRPADFASRSEELWVPETIPVMRVYQSLAQDILRGSGTTIEELLRVDDALALKTEATLSVHTSESVKVEARNILGVLPGRDPDYADEIIVIGAHYDHMGVGPDGTMWAGANDNASGVASILEIARSWNALGFVPRRTVLFAAWDAEEWGLLGSYHYVRHPSYPLDNTVASFQLDMVGAGPGVLAISGSEALAQQQQEVADMLGIEAITGDLGRSDHVPFLETGVPATLLIWHSETEPNSHYHRPADRPQVIEPERLESALKVVDTAVLDLAESVPAIEQLVNRRATAATQDNPPEFLSTSHPDRVTSDSKWLSDLQTLKPEDVQFVVQDIEFQGQIATGEVKVEVIYGDEEEHLQVAQPVHFSHTESGWRWVGPALSWHETAAQQVEADGESNTITIGYPPDVEADQEALATYVGDLYQQVANTLSLSEENDVRLLLLPEEEAIRFNTSLILPADQSVWIEPGAIQLVYRREISRSQLLVDSVVQLVLADAGVSEQAAPWLWQGLPIAWQAEQDLKRVHSQHLPVLLTAFGESQQPPEPSGAWAAVEYVIQRLGWQGLGHFIEDFGQACASSGCDTVADLDQAMLVSLQMDMESFNMAWQEYWRAQLEEVQVKLNRLLQERTQALRSGDKPRFLATMDDRDTYLLSSESVWFDRQLDSSLTNLGQSALPITLFANGDVLATVTMDYQLTNQDGEAQQDQAIVDVLFTVEEDGYKWAGYAGQTLATDLATVRYPDGQLALAHELLNETESRYADLANTLQVRVPQPIVVELFPDRDSFRIAIGLAYPTAGWLPAWSEPGSGIKLQLQGDDSLESYRSALAYQLARNLLYQKGLGNEWLLKGIGAQLAIATGDRETQRALATTLFEATAVGDHATLDLLSVAQDELLSSPRWLSQTALAWDSIVYLVSVKGWPAVLTFLEQTAESGDLATSFDDSFGQTLAEFEQEWQELASTGYASSEWRAELADLDGQVALDHVSFLGDKILAGRRAGTPGAELAADYIAQRFADYGLQPAGDLHPGSYMQSFTITYTERLEEPILQISEDPAPYVFREDYLSVYSTLDPSLALGELVWLGESSAEDLDLSGKIALATLGSEPRMTVESAVANDAIGLVILGLKKDEVDLFGKQPLAPSILAEIPVLELTLNGSLRLLELLDLSIVDIRELPAGTPLEIEVGLASGVSTKGQVRANNVLGLMPGSDPLLGQQVIILGAHYDHVGDDPPGSCNEQGDDCSEGVRYSGLNDNASGVALLLEIARFWQQIGYRPKFSVLFAAWGAQEPGELGSSHYVQQPILPLSSTIAMLQMDGVGGGEGFHPGLQAQTEADAYVIHYMMAAADQLEQKLVQVSSPGISDHIPFSHQDIPAGLVSWRLARENNLPDDLANGVSAERIAITGRLVALALMMMAR